MEGVGFFAGWGAGLGEEGVSGGLVLLVGLGLCWFGGGGDGVGGGLLLLLVWVGRIGVGILVLVVGERGRYGRFFFLVGP